MTDYDFISKDGLKEAYSALDTASKTIMSEIEKKLGYQSGLLASTLLIGFAFELASNDPDATPTDRLNILIAAFNEGKIAYLRSLQSD